MANGKILLQERSLRWSLHGDMYNYDEREYDNDYYTQPGKLWRLMSAEDKRAACSNTATQMEGVPLFIKQRHVRACHNADEEYGKMLAEALGIDLCGGTCGGGSGTSIMG